MESLAPSFEFVMFLKQGMHSGQSLRMALLEYVGQRINCPTRNSISIWLIQYDQGIETEKLLEKIASPSLRQLLELLEIGLQGHPIYPHLCELEKEIHFACQNQIEKDLAALPFKALVPLLLFMFPAYLLMLFGPLVSSFIQELNQ